MPQENVEVGRSIYAVRDGKAIRFRWFNTAPEALEAVGLSE